MAGTREAIDAYGFPLDLEDKQQINRWSCSKVDQQNLAAWRALAAAGGTMPRKSKLKPLLRAGVPVEFRARVWMEVSGANQLKASSPMMYYSDMANRGEDSPSLRQVELDLPRTFPTHTWLQSPEGQGMLRRVLLAFTARNPNIGYCQSMNYLAGFLLLVLQQTEEDAFFMLVKLIEDIIYPGTYSANLSGCHVEMRTLGDLLKKKMPKLSKHLEDLGADVSILATDWYLCLFATTFPSETTARVWDALMLEGGKVLFRVAIAYLQMHQQLLLSMDNAGELLKALKDSGRGVHDRESLMKTAFKGIGSFPMAKIKGLRATHQVNVDEMVREREARKRRQDLKEAISNARQLHSQPSSPPPTQEAQPDELPRTVSAGFSRFASSLSQRVMGPGAT